jgi:LPS sulfotransferase NodH
MGKEELSNLNDLISKSSSNPIEVIQKINGPEFDVKKNTQPTLRYLIISSPQSGAPRIIEQLAKLENILGVPNEYLHRKSIIDLSKRFLNKTEENYSLDVNLYMTALERFRTTEDGSFAFLAKPDQLKKIFGKDLTNLLKFVNHFDRIIFICRKDKVEQAISSALGFNRQGVPRNDANKINEKSQLSDSEKDDFLLNISKLISKYHEDLKFFAFLKKNINKPFLDISFEDIKFDLEASLGKIISFLRPGESNNNLKLDIRKNEDYYSHKNQSVSSIKEIYLDFICGKG